MLPLIKKAEIFFLSSKKKRRMFFIKENKNTLSLSRR
jgi:hypothetical protein